MKDKPNYYAIIPAEVRYDKDLTPNAKLLYGELTALANAKGYAWCTNSYLSDLYEVSTIAISRWINTLKRKGYIYVSIDKGKGNSRHIMITPINNPVNTPINKKIKRNNTSINNIKLKESIPPELDDVKNLFLKEKKEDESMKFYDYYESKGWTIGASNRKMKSWEAAARNWIRRSQDFNKENTQNNNGQFPNEYNKKYEWSIKEDQTKLNKYYKHLRTQGWTCIHSPTAGTIWRK